MAGARDNVPSTKSRSETLSSELAVGQRHVLFPPETDATVTPLAGLETNNHFIDKHRILVLELSRLRLRVDLFLQLRGLLLVEQLHDLRGRVALQLLHLLARLLIDRGQPLTLLRAEAKLLLQGGIRQGAGGRQLEGDLLHRLQLLRGENRFGLAPGVRASWAAWSREALGSTLLLFRRKFSERLVSTSGTTREPVGNGLQLLLLLGRQADLALHPLHAQGRKAGDRKELAGRRGRSRTFLADWAADSGVPGPTALPIVPRTKMTTSGRSQ